ncbi:alpha/beta fold hydrolase [Bacillus sp. T33-2]|uniref:alpha/beta fold hydrolase n=1 Tax=Bacillus sp. T33-2 TaxID=2054168 RepID=UPI000C7825F9|nr:alpha/beta fold hydrolase [Bacillus sp. T33-2]PLR97650.1 esterase [Bacillus sp. T33-2]
MICIENQQIIDIPVLHMAKQDLLSEKLPLIIFIHGFTSAKENNMHYAYLMAEKGFRVVLPDAKHHGERRQGMGERELSFRFWEIVLSTIRELKLVKEHFTGEDLADPGRIGVAGTSMGGIVTLGALTKYPWIKAAVSLMGNPAYEEYARLQIEEVHQRGFQLPFSEGEISKLLHQLREYDLSLHPEKLENRPLLFWHGELDPVVPYWQAHQFYEKIRPLYEGNPDKLHFISDHKAGHKVSQEGVYSTVEWFEKHL